MTASSTLNAMRFLLCFLFVSLVVWNSVAWAVSTQPLVGAASSEQRLLVNVNWLRKNLSGKGVVVVDVRLSVQYHAGHIRGAVNIPVQQTFSPDPPTDRMGPIDYIQTLIGRAGIDRDTDVVVYDDGHLFDAGRVFWMLEVYGHHRVAILDGGFPLWEKNDFEVSSVDKPNETKEYIASIQPDRLATKLHTRLAIDDESKIIIDARTPGEYSGRISESGRFGHIPTAVNVPADVNFQDVDGINVLLPANKLEELYKEFSRDKKIITYCNKGRASAFSYFVLRYIGRNVALYDGSWFEWGNDPDLPVEK